VGSNSSHEFLKLRTWLNFSAATDRDGKMILEKDQAQFGFNLCCSENGGKEHTPRNEDSISKQRRTRRITHTVSRKELPTS
jgi:hypothetical protein